MNVVARVDAVERWRADGEAGGLLGLVVGGDARVGRLVAARLVVLRDDLVHGHAPGHHRLQQWSGGCHEVLGTMRRSKVLV